MELAEQLWGNACVTQYICASGTFSRTDIVVRLNKEIDNDKEHHVQYWPIFKLESGDFIGFCGMRPHGRETCELGFHVRPEFWGHGYATEAAGAVIEYAFSNLKVRRLFAGHNPKNAASKRVLAKLGFTYAGDEFYAPTGLYHPSYELRNPAL
jgi:RimJ/RimL family protein N-acetyltransferase